METQANNTLYKLTRLFLVTLSLAHFSGFNSLYAGDSDGVTSSFNDPDDDSVTDNLKALLEKTAKEQGKISYRYDGEERVQYTYDMVRIYRELVIREAPENVPPRFKLIELTLQEVTQNEENLSLIIQASPSGKSEITFVNLILKTFFNILERYMKQLKEETSDILNESQKRLRAKLAGCALAENFKKEIMKEARELREGDIQQVEQLYKNFFVAYTETLHVAVIEKYLSPDLLTDDLKADLEKTLSDLKKRIMMLPGIKDNINKQE